MKKYGRDLIWLLVFFLLSLALVWPETHEALKAYAAVHYYRLGFFAFLALGALGEIARARLRGGPPPGWGRLAFLSLMWGLHGLALALGLWVVNTGVVMTQALGIIPGGGFNFSSNIVWAVLTSYMFAAPFFTSLFVNLGVVHPLLAAQRLGAAWFDLKAAGGGWAGSLTRAAEKADWAGFIRSELATLPFLRVSLMTLIFMMPQDLWLLLTAWLTAALTGLSGLYLRVASARPEN